jgi:hypothetical protein
MRFIHWLLSLLFPIRKDTVLNANVFDSIWDKAKIKESDEFYGGQDGTTWRYER